MPRLQLGLFSQREARCEAVRFIRADVFSFSGRIRFCGISLRNRERIMLSVCPYDMRCSALTSVSEFLARVIPT